MKVIKWILITLVILVLGVIGAGFLLPGTVQVERSITVKASREMIRGQIDHVRNWTSWSPWFQMDTAMKIEYHSIESGPGAGFKWASANKEVGSGELTIVSSTSDSICLAMDVMEHGTATAKFIFSGIGYSPDSAARETKLTWVMQSDMGNNPVGRIFGLFMDKMVGPTFEKGLANLKKAAERMPAGPKKYQGYEVAETDLPGMLCLAKKDSMGWDKVLEFYGQNLVLIKEAMRKAKLDSAGPPLGLFFKWDTLRQSTVMAVAFPVKGNVAKMKGTGIEALTIPGGKMLRIAYHGGYSGIGAAHLAMEEYINEKGLIQLAPVREEYKIGPGQEADSSKWITNVYYPVK